jgi:hypothetical protein
MSSLTLLSAGCSLLERLVNFQVGKLVFAVYAFARIAARIAAIGTPSFAS